MAFLYPWGNTQQLNLDWILQKIKDIEAGAGGADLDEISNALLAASYAAQAYEQFDIVFRDGKLYLANSDIPAPGEAWTPAHWDEILLGGPVSALMKHVTNMSSDYVINDSQVTGDTVSDALDTLKNAIDGITLDSDSVSNESQVTGDTVSDALDNLNGAINDVEKIIAPVLTQFKADTALAIGDFRIYNKELYIANQAISAGTTLVDGQNVNKVSSLREALTKTLYTATFSTADNFDITISANLSGVQIFVSEATQKSLTGRTGWTYLTNIPPICTPTKVIYMPLFTPDTTICFATIQLNPNGSLLYQPHTVTNQWLQASSSCILF